MQGSVREIQEWAQLGDEYSVQRHMDRVGIVVLLNDVPTLILYCTREGLVLNLTVLIL